MTSRNEPGHRRDKGEIKAEDEEKKKVLDARKILQKDIFKRMTRKVSEESHILKRTMMKLDLKVKVMEKETKTIKRLWKKKDEEFVKI